MDSYYDELERMLRDLILPVPGNQLEMVFYYSRLLSVLDAVAERIDAIKAQLNAGRAEWTD
jgi:hypothetical protein